MIQLLNFQLADNTKGCLLDADLHNVMIDNGPERVRSQHTFYEWLKTLEG